jgi:GAF domain-containing protein
MLDKSGPLTLAQAIVDAADLRDGIDSLAGLATRGLGLPALLAEVAAFTVHAVPGAEGASVTLFRIDRTDNMVEASAASDPLISTIEEIQHVTTREGPCITATLQRRAVRSGSLGGEKMWPRFGPRVGRLGVHSALSLPLMLPDQAIGAISVYARGRDVFDEHAAELGSLFAKPASVAIHNAHALAQAVALAEQLKAAMSTRAVIDQAIGLIRGRSGLSADDAFAQLRSVSQSEHRKLSDVAQRLVDEAVRRARARHNAS